MSFFSKNIFFLRTQKGLKQGQMKLYTGIARTTWSNYEHNLSEPSIEGLIKISNFFGISLDELLLVDLAARHPEKQLPAPRRKNTPIRFTPQHEPELNMMNEPESDLSFIMTELKRLRREVNTIKGSDKKKK